MNAATPLNSSLFSKKDGKYLYAIAYEYRLPENEWKHGGDHRDWRPGIEYMHADSDGDVRVLFLNSESPEFMRHVNIVGIAPVVGYHVNDNHGDKLEV